MAQTKQNNIIFMEGKEKAIQSIFDTFKYLAVGYNKTNDTNGFSNIDPDDETSTNGFQEISISEDSTYERVPLNFHSITNRDEDSGKITAKFTAELDLDNIINNIKINQIAIVDSEDVQSASTTFFAAAVTEEFTKSEKLALVFGIEITI